MVQVSGGSPVLRVGWPKTGKLYVRQQHTVSAHESILAGQSLCSEKLAQRRLTGKMKRSQGGQREPGGRERDQL